MTSPAKGPKKEVVVDENEVSLPHAIRSNSGPEQNSDRGPRKHGNYGMPENKKTATGFKKPRTPINLFEDECIFCHSFRTSQFHGPMVHYQKGKLVSSDKVSASNLIYVHEKCLEWAPRVYDEGDTIRNLESEIKRASKLKCTRCMLPGAALGCYDNHCNRSYHVPCAVMTLDCRWDVGNGLVLCPDHANKVLPCDEINSLRKGSGDSSSYPQSQFATKGRNSTDCEKEDCQLDQSNTSGSLRRGQNLAKQGISAAHKSEIDQFNTSCSSQGHSSQYLDKEGTCTDDWKEEKQVNHLYTETNRPSDPWVLLGTTLSASEKDSLQEFASWTNATVANTWTENVTHVIVGQSTVNTWSRSYEALMALLFGKWVVTMGWILDCLEELRPPSETSYELGKIRASEGAQKLFSGLYFCLSSYLNPDDREHIQNLIAAAGGQILETSGSGSLRESLENVPEKPYFVYDGGAPSEFSRVSFIIHKEMEESWQYVACGAQVISHFKVFDAIASCDAQILSRKDHLITPYV